MRQEQIGILDIFKVKYFKVHEQSMLNIDDICEYVKVPHWIEGDRSSRHIQLLKEAIYFKKLRKEYDQA